MKERTFKKMIFAVFCCQFLSIPLFAQQQKVDTTHTYSIPEITVSDIYQTREVRSTAPPASILQRRPEKPARPASIRRSETLCRSDRKRLRRYWRTKNSIHTKPGSTTYRCWL